MEATDLHPAMNSIITTNHQGQFAAAADALENVCLGGARVQEEEER